MTAADRSPSDLRASRAWLWFGVPLLFFLSRNAAFFKSVLQGESVFHPSAFLHQWVLVPACLAAFLAVLYGLGSFILDRMARGVTLGVAEDLIFSVCLGLGAHSLIVLMLGLWVGVKPAVFAAESVALLLVFHRRILNLPLRLWERVGVPGGIERPEEVLCLGLLAWIFVCGWVTALAPPVDGDSLGYHLGNAAQYVLAGRISYQPGFFFTAFPGTLEMNYLYAVALRLEALAPLIPLVLEGFLVSLIVLAGREFFGSLRVGMFGAAVFAAQPVFTVALGTSMQDGAAALFVFAGLFCLLRWRSAPNAFWYRLAAVFAGLALSTKYSAAPFAVLLAVAFAWIQARAKNFSFLRLALFGFIVAAIFLPWALRNAVWTGNPVWPLANSFFKGRDCDLRKSEVMARIESLPGRERTLKSLMLLPYRMIAERRFAFYYNPEYMTWPFLVLFAAFLFIRPPWPGPAILLSAFAALSAVALYSTASFWRYFLPALAGFSLVFAWVLDVVRQRARVAGFAILLLLFAAVVRLNTARAMFPAFGFSVPGSPGAPRESYLRSAMLHYPVYERIHSEVPRDQAVFLAEHYDIYYLERAFVYADPLFQGRINYWELNGPTDLLRLLKGWNAHWLLINRNRHTVGNPADRERMPDWYWQGQSLIESLISEFGVPVARQNGVELYRLGDEPAR